MKNKTKFLAMLLISVILATALYTVVLGSIEAKADTLYTKSYTELRYDELDDLTYRTSASSSPAEITVLTHGYDGGAEDWSMNVTRSGGEMELVYQEECLMEQLRKRITSTGGNATVMVATLNITTANRTGSVEELTSNEASEGPETLEDRLPDYLRNQDGAASLRNNYSLYENWGRSVYFTNNDSGSYLNPEIAINTKQSLTNQDVTKHIILVVDLKNSKQGNDYVYAQLEYILDSVSYQYLQLTGSLPSFNLIGQSRGGITNMQYALAHPYNVKSMYSIGTPFNGSAFGNAGNDFLDMAEIYPNYTYSNGSETTTDYFPGVLDILNKNLTDSYSDFWNNNYSYYDHIKFTPIGAYVTAGFMLQLLVEYLADEYQLSEHLENFLIGAAIGLDVEMKAIHLSSISANIHRFAVAFVEKVLAWAIREFGGNLYEKPYYRIISNIDFTAVLYKHISPSNYASLTYRDDLFIDLDSQLALNYDGTSANRRVRLMDTFDQMNGKRMTTAPAIAHILETQDPQIISYIINDINIGATNEKYALRYEGNNCIITNFLKYENEDILQIPETINGYTVVGIESFNMAVGVNLDDENATTPSYYPNLTDLIIPKTVTNIGSYAFAYMTGLEFVDFAVEGQSPLGIGDGAFLGCSNLQYVNFPARLNEVGAGLFVDCNKLQSINVDDMENFDEDYVGDHGVLYNSTKTELHCVPAKYKRNGTQVTSFSVPTSVSYVAPYAFAGNTALTTVNLANVTNMGDGAFKGCTALETISGDNVNYVGFKVIDDTAWYSAQDALSNDYLAFGNVLYRYKGNASTVSIIGYHSIAPDAFLDNKTVQKAIIGSETHSIGESAFMGCENLKKVYLNNINMKINVGLTTFSECSSGLDIFVPELLEEDYLNDVNWQAHDLSLAQTVVTYNTNGGTIPDDESYSQNFYYGGYVDLPTPVREHYIFDGWCENAELTGVPMAQGTYWGYYDMPEKSLYARWIPVQYYVNLVLNGGTLENTTLTYTYEQTVTIPEPSRIGYEFLGWYTDSNFAEGTKIAENATLPLVTHIDNLQLYAKWSDVYIAPTYTIELLSDYGIQTQSVDVCLGESKNLPVLSTEGRDFLGWYTAEENGTQITNNQGAMLNPWDIMEDSTLYARWQTRQYSIVYLNGYDHPNPTILTIDVLQSANGCIELIAPQARAGYSFMGWYRDAYYNIKIGEIETLNNYFIYGYWKELFTITFNTNNSDVQVDSITAVDGAQITLPEAETADGLRYVKTWQNLTAQVSIDAGNLYTVDRNIQLTAVWKGKIFSISYQNINFENVNATLSSTLPSGTSYLEYEYGVGLDLSKVTATYRIIADTQPDMWFLGWYTNMSLNVSKNQIATTEHGDKIVYAKWRYDYYSTIRNNEYTITDSGRFNQSYDICYTGIRNDKFSELKKIGMRFLMLRLSFDMREVNYGSQYVFVYDGESNSANLLWSTEINYGGDSLNTNYGRQSFTIPINIDSLNGVSALYIRFGASGSLKDDWKNKNLRIEKMYVVNQNDINLRDYNM